jgi:hypothetical protein
MSGVKGRINDANSLQKKPALGSGSQRGVTSSVMNSGGIYFFFSVQGFYGQTLGTQGCPPINHVCWLRASGDDASEVERPAAGRAFCGHDTRFSSFWLYSVMLVVDFVR